MITSMDKDVTRTVSAGPAGARASLSSLLLARTRSHDGDGLGVPPHFSFGRVRPESSSRTETAPSATKQHSGSGFAMCLPSFRTDSLADRFGAY
jgi:hypothetical protein